VRAGHIPRQKNNRMPRSLLIVDDDTRVSAALARGLDGGALQVRTAPGAERAIGMLAAAAPDSRRR
jgi:ActR/RegA family two-component response regulator